MIPASKQRHTAEIVAMTSWEAFARWSDSTHRNRPEDYTDFKAAIESQPAGAVRAVFSGIGADGRRP